MSRGFNEIKEINKVFIINNEYIFMNLNSTDSTVCPYCSLKETVRDSTDTLHCLLKRQYSVSVLSLKETVQTLLRDSTGTLKETVSVLSL